ncbi:MAG: hypothetical protein ACOY6K_21255 [Pseudomonadota bacterium]
MDRIALWVDEDERIWAPERRLLTGLGFDVIAIGDASAALAKVQDGILNKVDLIILDVMLLRGENDHVFSAEATQDGLTTGLILAREIATLDPKLSPKMVFFTRATEETLVSLTRATAADLGMHFLAKGPRTQGRNFVNWLKTNGIIC